MTNADISLSLPSDSNIVTNRSIWDFGRASRIKEGKSDWCNAAERVAASVS